MRGATTGRPVVQAAHPQFQSTHPLRGATMVDYANLAPFVISIHAPLAGCDFMAVPCVVVARHFNPRTPCGARRVPADDGHRWQQISIHAPLAGRDDLIRQQQDILANFNPRAPCGARRDRSDQRGGPSPDFNPRAPCGARRK